MLAAPVPGRLDPVGDVANVFRLAEKAPCPLIPGRYTMTQEDGASVLRVSVFSAFPLPSGGTLIQEVGASDAACIHETVIPFPGGLSFPLFCIPVLGLTAQLTQTGCGVGRIDSDGGSDFTLLVEGDTSEAASCGVPQDTCPTSGPAPDSWGRMDVIVGDGVTDACASGGSANVVAAVPVELLMWHAEDGSCPDVDGTFESPDTFMGQFPLTFAITSDVASSRFVDLDGDGCSRSGSGPQNGIPNTGACLDLDSGAVSTASAGMFFSSIGPLYDSLYVARLSSVMTGPDAPLGASCPSPPPIDFAGVATGCIGAP